MNERWAAHDGLPAGLFPFVLTGQTINRKLYDVLNTYTDEMGSDGVVRVATANMNYGIVSLTETDGKLAFESLRRSPRVPLAVLPGLAHSGTEMGIIRSVTLANAAGHPTTKAVLQCLGVKSKSAYDRLTTAFEATTGKTQAAESSRKYKIGAFYRTFKTHRCSMLVFRLRDDTGLPVTDYDLKFTAGADYDENSLPAGFFVDRQRNQRSAGKLSFYLDYDVLNEGLGDKLQNRFGLSITARPEAGLARYGRVQFQGTGADIVKAIRPNETLMVEIVLRRKVDRNVFTLTDELSGPQENFNATPAGIDLPPPS